MAKMIAVCMAVMLCFSGLAMGQLVQTQVNAQALAQALTQQQTVQMTVNAEALANLLNSQNTVQMDVNADALAQVLSQQQQIVQTQINAEALAQVLSQQQQQIVQTQVNAEALARASGTILNTQVNAEALAKVISQQQQAKPIQLQVSEDTIASLVDESVELSVDLEALQTVFPGPLSSFSFSDCAAPSAAGHVQTLVISPDPVQIPGNLTISLNASLSANQSAPIKADIKIQKKTVLGWTTIPCIDNVGSCSYDDLCALLEKSIPLVNGQCPPDFLEKNIPCRCPIPKASIAVSGLSVAIPKLPPSIPASLLKGDFKLHVELTGSNSQQLACVDIELSLAD